MANQPLDRDPVVLLHDVARLLRTKFDQRARARGMTRAQWHILARVNHQPGLSQSELAAICEVEPITVARLVDRLEKRGLLERRADPADRRIWRLHVLPPAQEVLDEITAYREELIRNIDSFIGRDAREALVNALSGIRAQINDVNASPTGVSETQRDATRAPDQALNLVAKELALRESATRERSSEAGQSAVRS